MAWEHDMAMELKKRNNPETMPWFSGRVTSPTRHVDPETGEETYDGPLLVSCFGGEVILGTDRLRIMSHYDRLYAGLTVALCGNPFSKDPGSQSILVVGVIGNAF